MQEEKTLKSIITIGRQFGSGGHQIGVQLANELNIPFYDKNILEESAMNSGISLDIMEKHDEKQPSSSFLYSLVMDSYSLNYPSALIEELPVNQKIFMAQSKFIRELAEKGPCVIVGRCADFILEEFQDHLSVFIYASMDKRVNRIANRYDVTASKARDLIRKTDKQRSNYYNYYTHKIWGSADSYHACLDSGSLGIKGCADAIRYLAELKERKDEDI